MYRSVLESHNPIFFDQTALTIFFGHYGFDRLEPLVWELLRLFTFFFNKMLKKYGFATSRLVWEQLRLFTAFFQQNVEKIRFCYGQDCNVILIWPFFLVITGKNNILPKKTDHYGIFPKWPENFVFLAFQVVISMLYLRSPIEFYRRFHPKYRENRTPVLIQMFMAFSMK